MTKTKKILLYGVPVALGLYLIFRQFSKGRAVQEKKSPDDVGGGTKTRTSAKSVYPLKKGVSNSEVEKLQDILNIELNRQGKTLLVVDGIFGNKTEAALISVGGRLEVKNESELSDLRREIESRNFPYITAPNVDDIFYKSSF